MKNLIFINGTMGVGKTATGKQLQKLLPKCVFLDGDWCWDALPLVVTEETKNMVLQNISYLLNNFLSCSEYENIIFCWVMHEQSIIDDVLSRIESGDYRIHKFSLVCSESALVSRITRDVESGIRTEDVISLPFPAALKAPLFENVIMGWLGMTLCVASLAWFAVTLKAFGDSFRIGIDKAAPDKLVTDGVFAISRNPIYLAFISFILGMFLVYPNIAILLVLVLFVVVIHRQVLREEKFLRGHYGEEYETYCRQVRRYL